MIKQIVLTVFFLFVYSLSYSQTDSLKVLKSDTLFTFDNSKIPCKVTEIGEDEIKYKKADMPDGPVYVISKDKVRQIVFANGIKETIKRDQLSMAPAPEVINQRRVIKVHPFSPLFNKVTVGYEQVLKVGMNLEVKVGYINSNIDKSTYSSINGSTSTTGAYVQAGVKFLLGQEYYIKGMKYAHPLKGRYIRIEGIASDLSLKNLYGYMLYNPTYGTYTQQTVNGNAFGYGLFVTYGRQWVLANMFTLDYYIGLGASGVSASYSSNNSGNNVRLLENNIYNYYGFLRAASPFSATYGLTFGYIIK